MRGGVGVLLVTHSDVGGALLHSATQIVGQRTLHVAVLPVPPSADPTSLENRAVELVGTMDQGAGVLVLTDIFGATPSNIAQRLTLHPRRRGRLVSGLNLPMLVRVMNYPDLDLDALATKAYSGGHDGILAVPPITERDQ